jgi:exodeoxyribonuclease VII small subunit
MPKKVELPDTELSFETAMERLEKIVEQMESSKLPLEELIVRYEEGIQLIATCNDRLAAAENRIETLSSVEKPAAEKQTQTPGKSVPVQSKQTDQSDQPNGPTKNSYDEISLF